MARQPERAPFYASSLVEDLLYFVATSVLERTAPLFGEQVQSYLPRLFKTPHSSLLQGATAL